MAGWNDLVTEADEDDGLEDGDDAQEWAKEMGFPDQLGVLRVWVNDDVLVERVRLSIHWRTRLGDQPLESAFAEVFMLINNHQRRREHRTHDCYEPDREAAEPLSWEALARLRDRQDEIRREIQTLGDGGCASVEGEETIGVGHRGKVAVKLNLVGQLAGVEFDQQWLRTARIKEISDGVEEAHADARQRFVPGEVILGERERLVNELSGLRNEALAMMRRGFY